MTHEFDYIIVGAGSAGCVLANRLSENPKTRVLLIEAGGSDKRLSIKVPLGYAFTFTDPKVNWKFQTQPDRHMGNRPAYWPRGRVIGGSSSINAMVYYRGLPGDFDDWERAGAVGWNWETVQKTYERIETSIGMDGKTVGNGPLTISDVRNDVHLFSQHFIATAKEMGWSIKRNSNDDAVGYIRATVKNGVRVSAADAFLHPIKKRPNLTLWKNCLVDRVLFDGTMATSISCNQGGKPKTALATSEVILSAGAIGSPTILQRSGIGPTDLLNEHQIDVVADAPMVGEGLQDHLALVQYFSATVPTLNSQLGNWFGRIQAGLQYLLTRCGPLSLPVNHVSGFVRSDNKLQNPDMQVYCNAASYVINPNGVTKVDKKPGFLICAQPSRPTSKGSIRIASKNAEDAPLIKPNSLSTQNDRDAAVAAGRLIQNIANSPSLSVVTKSANNSDFMSMNDTALLQLFKDTAGTVFHPCGTCAMGNVLDAKLRVKGVTGLRVIDASAFPNITSGNTNAPTIMLAMRGADFVLEAKQKH